MELSGNQYAKVAARLQEFRKDNVRGSIKTDPQFLDDGDVHFTAYIIKDKADPTSADATGHSYGKKDKVKGFEKLETIAIGRALAVLGYAASGEIASSEEMEDFEAYKQTQKEEAIMEWTSRLADSKTLEELAKTWTDIPSDLKPDLLEQKNELKTRLAPAPKEGAPVVSDAAKKVVKKAPAKAANEPNHETP